MGDAERLPAVRIPRYLSIHWGWLLLVSVVEMFVQARPNLGWLAWVNAINIWSYVQAIWLFRVDGRSRALFWYVAAGLLGIPVQLATVKLVTPPPGAFPDFHVFWVVWAAGVALMAITLGGIFVFRYEMQRFFRERGNPGMHLSLPMTFFFNILYFQYYFHNIAEAQRGGLRITPASA